MAESALIEEVMLLWVLYLDLTAKASFVLSNWAARRDKFAEMQLEIFRLCR